MRNAPVMTQGTPLVRSAPKNEPRRLAGRVAAEISLIGALLHISGCPRGEVAVRWRRFWEGSTMRNSKIAMLGYGLAVGFILVVAFNYPAKVLVAADVPAPTTDLSAK